jgi:hypothetical protein
MMDLTASDHDLRCDRIRDVIVAPPCSTKPRRLLSDRHHTVTADDDGFGSDPLKPGTSTARFNKPGTYLFHCESHRGSRGEVIVT